MIMGPPAPERDWAVRECAIAPVLTHQRNHRCPYHPGPSQKKKRTLNFVHNAQM